MTGIREVTITMRSLGSTDYELGCPACHLFVRGGVDEKARAHDVALAWHFERVAKEFAAKGCGHITEVVGSLPTLLRRPESSNRTWTIPVVDEQALWSMRDSLCDDA